MDSGPSLGGTIVAALCIQEGWGFPNPGINNPVWYISVLLLCYVIFYYLVYKAKREKFSLVCLLTGMVFLGIGVSNYGISLPFINSQTARGFYAFFFGCLLAMALHKHPVHNNALLVSIPVCAAVIYVIHYHSNWMAYGYPFVLTYVLYPAMVITMKAPCISKLFRHQWIGELSRISFDVFVWHCPLFSLMYDVRALLHWEFEFSSVRAMLCYTLVCFAVGIMSYYLLEKPMNRLIDKKVLNHSHFAPV